MVKLTASHSPSLHALTVAGRLEDNRLIFQIELVVTVAATPEAEVLRSPTSSAHSSTGSAQLRARGVPSEDERDEFERHWADYSGECG